MKIYCLCENTSSSDKFLYEHGLSLYIEIANQKILFDMGQSSVFIKNAETLGVDLSKVNLAFLSHGHYDHSGGINDFLKINEKAKIFISENAFAQHYNANGVYNGIDQNLINENRLVLCKGDTEISEDVRIYSAKDSDLLFPIDSAGLQLKTKEGFVPDKFYDEQYVEIKEGEKTYILSGCSHRGILNIAKRFSPDYLIGGFHFMKQSATSKNPVLDKAASELIKMPCTFYTCHCTGIEQYTYLKNILQKKLNYIRAGDVIEI